MTKPAPPPPPEASVHERLDRIERLLVEVAERLRPKPRARRQVERARAHLVAVHTPTELDRAAARKALARHR